MTATRRQPATLPAPTGLGRAGTQLWERVTRTYELAVTEEAVLAEACRSIDLIRQLEAELVDQPLVVPGSTGQQQRHPLLAELRLHRAQLAALLAQLDPGDDNQPATVYPLPDGAA